MVKYLAVIITAVAVSASCMADTFTHKESKKTFNGYVVHHKKGDLTQVRVESGRAVYVDLKEYDVQRNYLGRKNRVYTFTLDNSIELVSEIKAVEEELELAANQGPMFILFEIDTPGGRIDLAQRICSAINAVDNCTTVAYVSGEKFGGAFSAGAIIAMACDKVAMKKNTSIGAAALYAQTENGTEDLDSFYGKVVSEKINSAWRTFAATIAEKNYRPALLVKAMIDQDQHVIEVVENGKRSFISPDNKTDQQTVLNVWSKPGSLLTLTAEEARKTGVADKLVNSKEDIFEIFFAPKANEVKSRAQIQARRQFEAAKKKLDEQLTTIEKQRKQADIIIEQINELQGSDNNSNYPDLNFRYRYDRYARSYAQSRAERLAVQVDELTAQLQSVLDRLIRNYESAISVAKQSPDLEYYIPSLQKGLKWADATLFQITNQPENSNRNGWDRY